MTSLHRLYREQGQSPWLDDLKRSYLNDGTLARMVDEGIRGVTSNPTIFAKAIAGEDTYDDEFAALVRHQSVTDAYWRLVMEDVTGATGLLRATYDESVGADGFVSLEVAPDLAHDTAGTVNAARWIHTTVDRPNLLVKIPATQEGVPAIRTMIGEGRNINVTLIFSLSRYADVIEAYIGGLEDLVSRGGDPTRVASVASFFVSRVDTETDRRLTSIGTPEALALRGRAAVANAKLAYELFEQRFSGPRWEALAAKGAQLQRPLWASTSTKNPDYPDLLYVDTLIGPHTVNTMPESTITAFEDHGTVARTVDTGVDDAHRVIEGLASVGVDFADVGRVLEDEGVAAFAKSFDELIQALTDKANTLSAS
ncbi:MAG TPA: transaldolase [Acidimicrobiales bacterium]|nr:transaldolase [Acidimicrobiales bacterium]